MYKTTASMVVEIELHQKAVQFTKIKFLIVEE